MRVCASEVFEELNLIPRGLRLGAEEPGIAGAH